MATRQPGDRMLNPTQSNKAAQGLKNTPVSGVSTSQKPVQPQPFKAPSGYTRLSPGMYRDPSGKLVTQQQIVAASQRQATPAPKPKPKPKPAAPPPPAGVSGATQQGAAGTTTIGAPPQADVVASAGVTGAPVAEQPAAGTAGTAGTAAADTGAGVTGAQRPMTYEEYMSQFGPTTTTEEEAINIIPPELWGKVLEVLQGPLPEAPTTALPTQESLGQLLEQRYQQELADLTLGTEERQRKEQERREQDLINRGISPDSEAYRAEQRALAESRALEAAQARQQARAFAEQSTQSEYNRALAAAQEQRAAYELAMGARFKPLESLSPLIQTQAQLQQNRWATKFQADVQRDLTAMGLASDEKKFFANLGQQDRQFFEALIREDRKFAADQAQWDKTFKESIRQFDANLKTTNKKVEADIRNDQNLTKIQKDQLIEMVRSNKAREALEARRIAAINRGDTKTAADVEAQQSAVVQGQIKGYYNSIKDLVGAERAKEMVEDRFGAGGGGIDIG